MNGMRWSYCIMKTKDDETSYLKQTDRQVMSYHQPVPLQHRPNNHTESQMILLLVAVYWHWPKVSWFLMISRWLQLRHREPLDWLWSRNKIGEKRGEGRKWDINGGMRASVYEGGLWEMCLWGVKVGRQVGTLSNGLHDATIFYCSHCCRRQHRGEHKVRTRWDTYYFISIRFTDL